MDARTLFEEGRALYDVGAFAEAAKRFEASYVASGRADLLYNIYLAYRDANQLQSAADALRRYLAEVDDPPNRKALLSRLRILDASLAAAPGAADSQPSTAVPQAAVIAEPEPPPAGREAGEPPSSLTSPPSAVDPGADVAAPSEGSAAPWVLMAGGGALIAGGVVTGLLASADRSALREHCSTAAPCDPAWESTRDRGQLLAVTTDALFAGGLLAATAGLVWWLLGDGDQERSLPRAEVVCVPGRCLLGVHQRF